MNYMLNGGLGNQLFQLCHIEKLNFNEKDTYSVAFLGFQNIKLSKITKEILCFFNVNEKKDDKFIFLKYYVFKVMHKFGFKNFLFLATDVLNRKSDNEIFCSYFQWLSFNEILSLNSIIVDFFNFDLYEDRCFLHIRGGDYFLPKNAKIYSKLPISYYQKSIEHMISNYNVKKIIIFTNDRSYSQSIIDQLKFQDIEFIFSNNNTAEKDFIDMSKFKNGIISNSTFSFWSVMINNYKRKNVIAPSQWYEKWEYPKFINKEWIKK